MKLKEYITELEKLNLPDCDLVIDDTDSELCLAQPTVKIIYKRVGPAQLKFIRIEFEATADIEIETVIRRGVPVTRR